MAVLTVGTKFQGKHKRISIIDRIVRISPILQKIDDRLRRYKPIHLCWLFEKLGLPIPRYLIGEGSIDAGCSPIDRAFAAGAGRTYITKENPANASGKITTASVYLASGSDSVYFGVFYLISGNTLKCRSAHNAGALGAGLNNVAVSMDVVAGDFIGVYVSTGTVDYDTGGGAGTWWYAANTCSVDNQTAYNFSTPRYYSIYAVGITPPTAPSGCTSAYVATNNTKCTWNDNSGTETGQRIEVDVNDAGFVFWKNVGAGVEDSGTYTTGANKKVRFRVRAYNAGGDSAWSTSGYVYTIPTAPSGINLSWLSQDETVRITWTDNSAYEQDFDIEKATDGGGYGHLVYDAASPYDDIAPSGNDHRYIYRVRARCPDGRLSGWNTAGAYIYSTPSAPTNCAIALGTINVTWTDNSAYEDGFEVDRQLDGGGWVLVHTTAAEAESWGDSSQPTGANVKYEYRVRAKIGSSYSTYSTSNAVFLKTFSESIALSDVYSRVWSIYRTFTESISLSDAYSRVCNWFRTLIESITLADTLQKKPGKVFTENLTLVDTLQKKPSKVFTEAITLTDIYSRVWNIYRTFTETLSLADTLIKKLVKTFIENLHLTDTLIKKPAKIFAESITLADTLKKRAQRIFTETLSLTDTVSKKAAKTFLDTLHLQDRYTRVVTWYRIFTENVTLTDSVTKVKSNIVQLWKKLMNLFDIEG